MGLSLHKGFVEIFFWGGGNPFTGNSDSWKRAQETGHLSLWEFCEANLEDGLFTGGPEGYVEESSEDGQLSPHGHR